MTPSERGGGSDDGTLTVEIVRRVAELEGIDPLELDPLYDVVDVDALRAFFDAAGDGPSRAKGSVTFQYAGYEIVVDNGAVFVRNLHERSTGDRTSEERTDR